MTHHIKYEEAKTLINGGIPVLLTGEKGSGKTTMAKQIAEDLELRFFSVSMTRQTTLSYLLGFMNVNGVYIPSLLRDAVEHGGMYLLDELDAGDPNVLLSLNTIENGYVSFPDKLVQCHKDFRLVATANPQDQHDHYTGRAKLDAATLDRFDEIKVPRDEMLEKTLVDSDTFRHISALREALREINSSIIVSMRDSKRYQKRKELGLLDGVIYKISGENNLVIEKYEELLKKMPKHADQAECRTFGDLVELMNIQAGVNEPTVFTGSGAYTGYDPATSEKPDYSEFTEFNQVRDDESGELKVFGRTGSGQPWVELTGEQLKKHQEYFSRNYNDDASDTYQYSAKEYAEAQYREEQARSAKAKAEAEAKPAKRRKRTDEYDDDIPF